jgi:signal transduction histidine kinase
VRPLRDLPLLGKVLLPYLALLVVLAAGGTYLLTAALARSAEAAVERELSARAVDLGAAVRERELYLLEAVAFAANVEGMRDAVAARDTGEAARLLASTLALKADLSLAVVTDAQGTGVAEYTGGPGAAPATRGGRWDGLEVVRTALTGARGAALADVGGQPLVVVADPVCGGGGGCAPVGTALVGLPVAALVGAGPSPQVTVTALGADGRLLAAVGTVPGAPRSALPRDDLPVTAGSGGARTSTLQRPLVLQGQRVGSLLVTVPTAGAYAEVGPAAARIVALVLAVVAAALVVGVVLSRSLVRRVRRLVDGLERLGSGELGSRVPDPSSDELGQVAAGVNAMAARLQESYETLEQRVQERTEEVRRLLHERTQFFAAMTHEFRTPVAVVLSQAQLLADPRWKGSRAWQHESGRILQASGEQLLALVRDVLDLAEAESGRLDVVLEPVDLAEVLDDVERPATALTEAGGLDLRLHRAPLPRVVADADRLRQVLLGLLDNAVKYTPPGGTVSVRAEAAAGQVLLHVADDGPGIPPEERERVFEPFHRVRGNRPQRGEPSTGLGLAVARRLVEAQGGSIRIADGEAGRGTVVTVSLPAVPVPDQRAPEPTPAHRQPRA